MTDNYETTRELIMAIDYKRKRKPSNVPIPVILNEANELHEIITTEDGHKQAVVAAGLDWRLVESLPQRIFMLNEAQSRLNELERRRKRNIGIMKGKIAELRNIRDHVMHELRFCYADNGSIKMGMLLQDAKENSWSGMGILLSAWQQVIETVPEGVPEHVYTLLKGVEPLIHELDDLNSLCHRVSENSNAVGYRDKAYTYLHEAMSEICRHGRHAFWRDPAQYRVYCSDHLRRKRLKRGAAKVSPPTPVLAPPHEATTSAPANTSSAHVTPLEKTSRSKAPGETVSPKPCPHKAKCGRYRRVRKAPA